MKYNIETLWHEHHEAICRFIRKRVRREDDANDILQNVAIKSWKYFENNTTEIKNMRAWFFQVTQNAIADYYRRRKTYVPQDENMDVADQTIDDVYADAQAFLEPFMKLLPQEYATPLRMSEIDGIKQQLIAAKLNMSHGAVRTKISRARGMLKKKIEECALTEKNAAGHLLSFRIRTDCAPLQQRKQKTCSAN